jgi:hypothetical protein
MKPDGTDIRTAITTKQYAKGGHHMAWMPDGDHFSMNLEVDSDRNGLELITAKYDGSELKTVFSPGSGHPQFFIPRVCPLIITDAYRHEVSVTKDDGIVPIRLMNVKTGKETIIAKVRVPDVKDNSFRMDAPPHLGPDGQICNFQWLRRQQQRRVHRRPEKDNRRTQTLTTCFQASKKISWTGVNFCI